MLTGFGKGSVRFISKINFKKDRFQTSLAFTRSFASFIPPLRKAQGFIRANGFSSENSNIVSSFIVVVCKLVVVPFL